MDCYDYIFYVLEHEIKEGDLEFKENIYMFDCKYTILRDDTYRVLKGDTISIKKHEKWDIDRGRITEEWEEVSHVKESLLVVKVLKIGGREYNIGLLLEVSK